MDRSRAPAEVIRLRISKNALASTILPTTTVEPNLNNPIILHDSTSKAEMVGIITKLAGISNWLYTSTRAIITKLLREMSHFALLTSLLYDSSETLKDPRAHPKRALISSDFV